MSHNDIKLVSVFIARRVYILTEAEEFRDRDN